MEVKMRTDTEFGVPVVWETGKNSTVKGVFFSLKFIGAGDLP